MTTGTPCRRVSGGWIGIARRSRDGAAAPVMRCRCVPSEVRHIVYAGKTNITEGPVF
jgi:hypothetical protein